MDWSEPLLGRGSAAPTQAGLLAGYLNGAARRRFVWGETDCACFVGDWVEMVTGVRAGAALRERYATEAEAQALHGPLGLAGTIRRLAREAGLVRVPVAARCAGDVLLVRGDLGGSCRRDEIACALATVRGVALRTRDGVLLLRAPFVPVKVLAAWTVQGGSMTAPPIHALAIGARHG